MAVSKNKSLPLSKQPDPAIYQSLNNLNQAFQTIADEIKLIAGYGVFSPSRLKLYSTTTEEARSGLSHCVVEVLLAQEERAWANTASECERCNPASSVANIPKPAQHGGLFCVRKTNIYNSTF
jgi:hypothetical protein